MLVPIYSRLRDKNVEPKFMSTFDVNSFSRLLF